MAKKKDTRSIDEQLEDALILYEKTPYKVPDNWCWTTLGAVSKWSSGGTPSRSNSNFYEGEIPWIKTGDLNDSILYESSEMISELAVKKSSAKIFPKGSVLLAMYGATIGKCAILGIDATTNQACACALLNDYVDRKYMFHFLIRNKSDFISKGQGGAQPNISQNIIKAVLFPLAPLEEQKRIVEIIEREFEKLDEAKDIIQNALDTFADRKSAILYQAFSGELTSKWRKQKGYNCNYINIKLKDLSKIVGGGTPKSDVIENFGDDISWITPADMSSYESKYIICGRRSITKLGLKNSSAKLMPEGTVILSSRAPIGYVGIAKNELCTNQGFKSFVPGEKHVPEYLYYYLIGNTIKLVANASGSTFLELSASRLGEVDIDIPPIEEQKEIVRILDEIFEKEDKSKELLDVIDKIEEMKKVILARAFRGELSTNNPSDQPATELLKQIILAKQADELLPKPRKDRIVIPKDIKIQFDNLLEEKIYKVLIVEKKITIENIAEKYPKTSVLDILSAIENLSEKNLIKYTKGKKYIESIEV